MIERPDAWWPPADPWDPEEWSFDWWSGERNFVTTMPRETAQWYARLDPWADAHPMRFAARA